jgi:Cu/Ag efflux pump CusA
VITLWIDWCARNRFLVFTGTLVLLLAGLWTMRRIPLDALPDISDVQVIIHTAWNGEPPRSIQRSVVPGVAEVASIGGFVRQYQVRLDPTNSAPLASRFRR